MRILLLQLDGKLPNIALMKLAAHHRAAGDSIELRLTPTVGSVERRLGDAFDRVYGSLIFERTRAVAERLLRVYPEATVGGTGWDDDTTLESIGVFGREQDYSLYPKWVQSIGYTQRGCRLKCSFCKVPRTEPVLMDVATVGELWRGEPWPRELVLLDNDFFGSKRWREKIEDMRSGGFRVCFNQGINVRTLTREQAAAVATVDYRDDSMKARRLYTAWDNRDDEWRLFRGLALLADHGVKPDHIMVYVLIGYDHDAKTAFPRLTDADLYRRQRLREFGCRPYPMPFIRTPELVGFQRWVIGAYDKRFSWAEWKAAGYRPEGLDSDSPTPLFDRIGVAS